MRTGITQPLVGLNETKRRRKGEVSLSLPDSRAGYTLCIIMYDYVLYVIIIYHNINDYVYSIGSVSSLEIPK